MASIRDRIAARPDLAAARALRDLDAMTAALNAQPELTVQPRFVTLRAVMSGCKDGNAILDALDAAGSQNSAVRRAMKFLEQEAGLDIGNPYTQRMVDELVRVAVLTADQGAQLKGLALQPLHVSRLDVEAALFNPDGTDK